MTTKHEMDRAAYQAHCKTIEYLRGLVLLPHDAMTHVANLEHAIRELESDRAKLLAACKRIVEGWPNEGKTPSWFNAMETARAVIAEVEEKNG